MSFNISEWARITHNDTPVYLRPNSPDWFVPTSSGDKLLDFIQKNPDTKLSIEDKRFLMRLPDADESIYLGRYELLKTDSLRELWFHITDNCNMACTHCLFSSSPQAKRELKTERVLDLTAQAEKLGCRMFAITGGEPLVHKGLDTILTRMLEIESSHVAVLTNGLTVKKFFSKNRYDFNRLHLQISVDGIGKTHDKLRGEGMFKRLEQSLNWLSAEGIPFTLSMCVTKANVHEMKDVVEFAARTGASNVHFMWYFVRGRGESKEFVKPDKIYPHLLEAWETGERTGVTIDNVEAVKSMIFAPCGTIHDGSTAGWESLAVGPDENLYPSAATVGIEKLATCINDNLGQAWKESSALEKLRKSSGKDLNTPFKLILGGGDTDHSFMHRESFLGDDPYSPLYEKLALELITRKSRESQPHDTPQLLLKMGDKLDRCSGHGPVALTHTNCLLAVAGNNSLAVVKDFYTEAADTAKEDILNPACYDPALMNHIPEKYRFRGYGCGSPIMDAGISTGEHVVDLGSGRGIECFIAAKMTGKKGKVTGIDMLDPMLAHAREGQAAVADSLGYDNMSFRKGYLETLPLDEGTADLLLSNCVLNLSTDKRRTFAEMFRVLKPGGRLTISDVVCETEPGPEIRNDDTLHGECIAGAQTQKNLCGLLEEAGFESLIMIKRFPYRTVGGHQFFSLTFSARKPEEKDTVKTVYRGPLATAITSGGTILTPGSVMEIPEQEANLLGEQLFIINNDGAVDNVFIGESCCCPTPDSFDKPKPEMKTNSVPPSLKNMEGCMVCGADLEYLTEYRKMVCCFCGEEHEANGHCVKGHFVCDKCHSKDGMEVLPHLLKSSTETDMIELLKKARSHPAIPMHGPEHHALVPGVIAAAYKNSGGGIDDKVIDTAVSRGAKVAGGFCGFMGICGAAIGVGTAMSAILEATPFTASERSIAQKGTLAALKLIADIEAARCCQRDCWLALKAAAQVSEDVLGLRLKADAHILCDQMKTNKECMGRNCPVIRNCKGNQPPVTQLLGKITNSEKKV
ncbi:methyltransferase domain-containing protein [Marinifilum sp. JC120]|nr:methyltransferase domain-containing protein [Marinifilum sp. JC120]